MKISRFSVPAIATGLALAFSGGGVARSAPPSDNGGDHEEPPQSVRYIQADSREEAEEYFDQLKTQEEPGEAPAIRAANAKHGPCTIVPEGIHLRKSSGWQAVGFEVKTSCTTKVSPITHFSKLRQKSGTLWKEVTPTTGNPSRNFDSPPLYTQSIKLNCPSQSKKHYWGGSTLGEINYNGEMHFARVYAPASKYAIACHAA